MNIFAISVVIGCLTFISSTSNLFGQDFYGSNFRHYVTEGNSEGILTYIDHEELNNNPQAIFVASPNLESNGISVEYNFNLFYSIDSAKWAFRNSNGIDGFPLGSTFNVLIPSSDGVWFQTYAPPNSSSLGFDNSATNFQPNKNVFIAPIYLGDEVGNGDGLYVTVYAPSPLNMWGILRAPTIPMQEGETFNVFVPNQSDHTFVHRVSAPNQTTSVTQIDHPLLNGNPDANFIFQRRFTFNNNASTTYNSKRKSAAYFNNRWHIKIDDGNMFHHNEDYSIAILNYNTTGLSPKKNLKKLIEFYPNPADERITIRTEKNSGELIDYKIMDISGKIMVSGTLIDDRISQIEVKLLPDGIYILRVESKTFIQTNKLIVTH